MGKNARFDNLIEALEAEPSSLDYDSVFSSVQKIDSKAHELAKGYGVPVNSVYNAIDFDPAAYVKICAEDTDILDFSYSDIMRDLQLLEKQRVPEEHRKYGGKMAPLAAAMMVLMAPAPKGGSPMYIIEKPAPDVGEPVKRKEIVLKEDMGLVDYIIKGIRKHKTAIGLGILGTLGLYVGVNSLVNANKEHSDDTDAGIAKAKAGGILGGLTGTDDSLTPTPAPTVANGSAVKETPAPQFDYYDEVMLENGTVKKVGIYIEGDPMFKHNVTQMLQEMKKLTPERYKEVMPYAPKRIMRSPDNFNWYGGAPNDDVIQLSRGTEVSGGSEDLNRRKMGLSGLYPELRNAMRSKTGAKFNSAYESELDANKGKAEYSVELGLWTEEQATKYLENISDHLKGGTYFNGAVGINVTDANKKAAESR